MDKLKVIITNDQKAVKIPAGLRLMLRRCCTAVISVEHAVAQANEFGHTFEREMGYLTVHSMLHLLGYDHVNGGLEKTIMREKEEEALGRLGLTRDNTYVE